MGEAIAFTAETARAALEAILTALESEESAQKINEAKANAGNDMLKVMQYVFPLVVQVEMDVIKKYGFTDNREGIIQFTQMIVALEKEDDVIADLHSQVRSHYLPPVNIATDVSLWRSANLPPTSGLPPEQGNISETAPSVFAESPHW